MCVTKDLSHALQVFSILLQEAEDSSDACGVQRGSTGSFFRGVKTCSFLPMRSSLGRTRIHDSLHSIGTGLTQTIIRPLYAHIRWHIHSAACRSWAL